MKVRNLTFIQLLMATFLLCVVLAGFVSYFELTGAGYSDSGFTDPITGMEFMPVKGGCFQMGSTAGDDDEQPVHEVCVDDYAITKTEVTVGQFRKFVAATSYRTEAEKGDGCYAYNGSDWSRERGNIWRDPGFIQNDSNPVVCVSWNDTSAYVDWLNKNSNKGVRLPTEAEWEYAARSGGKTEKWAGTSSESSLKSYAWFTVNSGNKTHPVGQKQPNGIGLYDMTGNVWEWCSDWYDKDYYRQSPRNNPQGAGSGSYHVLRGGGWFNGPWLMRSAYRYRHEPGFRFYGLGFRLVLP